MRFSKLLIFLVVAVALRAHGVPPYERGILTAENAADYLAQVEAQRQVPEGFQSELMSVALGCYPPLSQDEVQTEDLASLDPHAGKERARVLTWLFSHSATLDRNELMAKVLKFDPDTSVREAAAKDLVVFKRLPTSLFELVVQKMGEDLDAEVRLALVLSLSVLHADMSADQRSLFEEALQRLSTGDVSPHVMNEAACALRLAQSVTP
ncbi:MAG: hypothetical protein KDD51_13030 [Bdellovibrionales bacterium]|nr:hypothetical protein [Bdellovibrionales bacterium]